MPKQDDVSVELIADHLDQVQPTAVRLYLLTRDVKDGVPANRKTLSKHIFLAHKIEIDSKLQEQLLGSHKAQIERLSGVPHKEYSVFDDDDEKVLVYSTADRDLAFMNVISEQLRRGVDIPSVTDLQGLRPKIWAYGVSYPRPDGPPLYAFTKTSSGKIGINRRDNADRLSFKRVLTFFDTSTTKLEILSEPTISLEGEAHTFFLGSQFLVVRKNQFEMIVGMEEEFVAEATNAIEILAETNLVNGLEVIREEAQLSKRLVKRLTAVLSDPAYLKLTEARLEVMERIGQDYGFARRYGTE